MLTLAALSFISLAAAQQVGDLEAESHPSFTWTDCSSGSCSEVQAEVVIDSNWRWTHNGTLPSSLLIAGTESS